MCQTSRRADDAVRIMIELRIQADECEPSREVSRRTNVSKAFFHKIRAYLVKANLIRTRCRLCCP
ncbi:MAG: hypothetical protein CSA11_05655 [Chloroflexi bacterium]|nr:MAG: hypothetical protein CSB13_08555 [Chloroflexota bacterium]PIE80944.1 MAG: hypothetical protein CSA11_05655 [Chloroflexota bacterium]